MRDDAPTNCPGDGPLRHADCTGCNCRCHWQPPATVAAGDFDDLLTGRG